MRKKPIFGVIFLIIIAIIIIFGSVINSDNPENIQKTSVVFHITLADPTLYENGVYVESFQIEEGVYEFGFVPNGDSPQKLSIKLFAESGVVIMDNHFELEGSLVEGETSSWYTWDYLGEKRIAFNESDQIKIVVSPNRNYNGSVSIDLIKLD